MNCPTNTYSCCNSCCSNPCGCKKTTTTSTTTSPITPCDVINCDEVIDIQCVVHNLKSDCLSLNNDNLQSVLITLFEKVTGYSCSCDFCGAIVEKVQND